MDTQEAVAWHRQRAAKYSAMAQALRRLADAHPAADDVFDALFAGAQALERQAVKSAWWAQEQEQEQEQAQSAERPCCTCRHYQQDGTCAHPQGPIDLQSGQSPRASWMRQAKNQLGGICGPQGRLYAPLMPAQTPHGGQQVQA